MRTFNPMNETPIDLRDSVMRINNMNLIAFF